MKKPDFAAVSNELKIKTLRDIAMGEAQSLPPAIDALEAQEEGK